MPDLSLTPQATLLTEATITAAIDDLKDNLLTDYEIVRLANWAMCNPEDRIKELASEISTADLEDIPALEDELNQLRAGGDDAKRNARGQVIAAFDDARAAIIALCQAIEVKLAAYRVTARAAEDAFFATYSQPVVRSAVSAHYDTALARVVAIRVANQQPQAGQSVPNARAIALFTYLGVAQIA